MLFGKCSDFTIDNRLADNDSVAGAFIAPQTKISSAITGSTYSISVLENFERSSRPKLTARQHRLVGQASRLSRNDGQDARPTKSSAISVITFENRYNLVAAPSTRDSSREERHLQIPILGNLLTGSRSTIAFETPIQGSAALGDFAWPAVR
jgi:hypothetical protein